MPSNSRTPERANGEVRSEPSDFREEFNVRDLVPVAAVLGPHVFAIVGIVASANWAVVGGANAYLAYGFACCGLVSYMVLALKGVRSR
jgi:hypothetical protein